MVSTRQGNKSLVCYRSATANAHAERFRNTLHIFIDRGFPGTLASREFICPVRIRNGLIPWNARGRLFLVTDRRSAILVQGTSPTIQGPPTPQTAPCASSKLTSFTGNRRGDLQCDCGGPRLFGTACPLRGGRHSRGAAACPATYWSPNTRRSAA